MPWIRMVWTTGKIVITSATVVANKHTGTCGQEDRGAYGLKKEKSSTRLKKIEFTLRRRKERRTDCDQAESKKATPM